MSEQMTTSDLARRTVLRAAAAGGVGIPLLAACGGGDTAGSGGGDSSSAGGGGGGGTLTSTADVPVGGGTVVTDQKVVVTQPTKGDFKAFTAVCTHQGCLVNSVSDGQIHCPCHGSAYSIKDGSVVGGPAPRPLAPITIDVAGGEIVRA